MTRHPVFRARKYDAKMDGNVVKSRFDAQRDSMVEQEDALFAELSEVERHAKIVLEEGGVSVVDIPMYLCFARQCYKIGKNKIGTTRINEVYFKYQTWVSRGLAPAFLASIALLCGTDITAY